MKIFENELYKKSIKDTCYLKLPWEKLENKSILVCGATGLIGSFLIDVIMEKNIYSNLNCKVYALGRTEKNAKERFEYCWDNCNFEFVSFDINKPLIRNDLKKINYIIHLASNTHPKAYSTDPIGTITTNIIGTYNLLEFAKEHECERFVFASSCEIYGENRGDVETFDEDYCGYINCNTMRAGYPESKRCGEALCQAYLAQEKIDIVIPRLTRTYGPTMLMSDTKALSQFIKNGINKENIVLKSEGNQYYSYTYVADAVSGILTIMLLGKTGECYNVADEKSDIRLKDLAMKIAKITGTNVVFELPDDVEKAGYSKATISRLDGKKLKEIGWSAKYDIDSGISQTIEILKDLS